MESKEENNRRKKFVGIFQKDIFPCLRTYEVARQRFFKKRVKTIILMIFSVVIAVFLCSFSFQLDASFNYIVFLLPFLFVVYMCNEYTKLQEKEKSLIEEIKKQCIPKILNLFDDITWIKKETRILSKDLDKSGLFLKYNDMITDDCFIGKYNNISFSVSEIKLIKENMFHDKIKFNIFSGIVFLFHLDKYVKNRTIATAKREFLINSVHFIDVATFILILIFIYKNIDFGCALLDIKIIFIFLILIIAICVIIYFEVSTRIKEEKLDKIILEDPQFNKKYNAYSSDQVEGRCILTTAFIERFQNLQTAFNSKNIKCSFYSNKLMIAISTNKNLFEICKINKSFENTKYISEFYKQISSIYHIIDYFKLDKKV